MIFPFYDISITVILMACLFPFFFWHFAELQLWAKTPVSPWRAAERAQSLDQCLHSGSVPKPRSTFLSTAPLSQFRPISVRIILINHLLFYFLFLVQCDGVSLLNVFLLCSPGFSQFKAPRGRPPTTLDWNRDRDGGLVPFTSDSFGHCVYNWP